MAKKTATAQTETSVKRWLAEWEAARADEAPPAIQKADRTRIETYILPTFARRSVQNISRAQIVDWVDTLKAQGVGNATIVKSLTILRGTLRLAYSELGLNADKLSELTRDISLEGMRQFREISDDEILTEDEIQALLAAFDKHFRALLLLAVRLGAKWEELLGLRLTDVNLNSKMITIGRVTFTESVGKLTEGTGTPRTLTMPDDVVAELREYMLMTIEWRTPENNWLFLTARKHSHPLRPNFTLHVWNPALKATGLDKRGIKFSSLRHTAAVNMIREGLEAEEVARAIGHEHGRSTQLAYRRFFVERGDVVSA